MKGPTACLVSCVMIGCGGGPNAESRRLSSEVETELAAVKNATIPSAIRLTDTLGPARQGSTVSAEWSFQLQPNWDAYASEVMASLQRVGYETVSRGHDAVALARHVPGDSYRVRIARNGPGPATRVTVSFSASPD
jgi:hypothetical protein